MHGENMKFVLIVVGQEFVSEVNLCLSFLKKFVKNEIVVVSSRAEGINHDNIENVMVDSSLSNLYANRFLKTMIHRIVPGPACYLDNDVLAVSEFASDIFRHFVPPVTFASDRLTLDHLSPWAVNEGKLSDAIRSYYGIEVDSMWSLWNGGVFVYDASATDFMDYWNEATTHVFYDKFWKDRDQAALAVSAWKFGLQNHSRLPIEYNWIVQHEHPTSFLKDRKFVFQNKQLHLMHITSHEIDSDSLLNCL